MMDLGMLSSPEFKSFREGWDKWVERTAYANLYWNPKAGQWRTFSPNDFSITDPGLPTVSVVFGSPFMIYPEVKKLWDAIKNAHPNARWSPHSGRWVLVVEKVPIPPPKGTPDQKMIEELRRIDHLYEEGTISAEERYRLRGEVFERYFGGSKE